MVDQIGDGKLDMFERATNAWMKISRGDIASRFDQIRDTYLDVARDTRANIDREQVILEAYRDFRGALKQAEVAALEVLKAAEGRLEAAKATLKSAGDAVAAYAGTEPAERAKLELARDEEIRKMQSEEGRYQVAKDLADNLTIGYNTSEVVMARLMQTTSAKERVYQQAVSFFSTNESVLTALKASFTGLFGLHESTQTLNQMKEGVSKSIEVLAEIGGKVQEEALKAGYGPTIRADAVKKLVDSVVTFQEALHRDHRRDAQALHPELRGDPHRRRGRQAADGAARRGGQPTGAEWLIRPWPRRRRRRPRSSTTSCWRWTWWTRSVTRRVWWRRSSPRRVATRPSRSGCAASTRPGPFGRRPDPRRGHPALKEARFTYVPAPPGMARSLAMLWVKRRTAGLAAAVVVAVVLAVGGWMVWSSGAERRAAETARVEIAETLPRQLTTALEAAIAEAKDPKAKAAAEALAADGRAALAAGDAAGARAAVAGLEDLRARLVRTTSW